MLLHMLDEIRSFIMLAESGSLRRASERLFLTPSALTRQIQRLEQALGTSLLDRGVKPARITRAGRAVLDRVFFLGICHPGRMAGTILVGHRVSVA